MGNYWRIRGNTYLAIECFRKALSRKTDNADVLLNLARVLYNLNYQQDAAYLARISLQVQSPEQNSWLQHFTLGEVQLTFVRITVHILTVNVFRFLSQWESYKKLVYTTITHTD